MHHTHTHTHTHTHSQAWNITQGRHAPHSHLHTHTHTHTHTHSHTHSKACEVTQARSTLLLPLARNSCTFSTLFVPPHTCTHTHTHALTQPPTHRHPYPLFSHVRRSTHMRTFHASPSPSASICSPHVASSSCTFSTLPVPAYAHDSRLNWAKRLMRSFRVFVTCVCICVYVCVCACVVYVFVRVCMCVYVVCVFLYVCVCVCMCVYMCACVCACVCVCVRAHAWQRCMNRRCKCASVQVALSLKNCANQVQLMKGWPKKLCKPSAAHVGLAKTCAN